jgi:co-chaperonin GroES (HSP10)
LIWEKTAFRDLGDGMPWVSIGDRVVIARYAGKKVPGMDKCYRGVNDEDLIFVLED